MLNILTDPFIMHYSQTLAMINFLYEDVEAPTEASMRFLRLEKIVSDFMSTCTGPTEKEAVR